MTDGNGKKLWYHFTTTACPVGMASARRALTNSGGRVIDGYLKLALVIIYQVRYFKLVGDARPGTDK